MCHGNIVVVLPIGKGTEFIVPNVKRSCPMKSNLELTDYESIAMNNIKRAALALADSDYNHAEACLGEALSILYKINKD